MKRCPTENHPLAVRYYRDLDTGKRDYVVLVCPLCGHREGRSL